MCNAPRVISNKRMRLLCRSVHCVCVCVYVYMCVCMCVCVYVCVYRYDEWFERIHPYVSVMICVRVNVM